MEKLVKSQKGRNDIVSIIMGIIVIAMIMWMYVAYASTETMLGIVERQDGNFVYIVLNGRVFKEVTADKFESGDLLIIRYNFILKTIKDFQKTSYKVVSYVNATNDSLSNTYIVKEIKEIKGTKETKGDNINHGKNKKK